MKSAVSLRLLLLVLAGFLLLGAHGSAQTPPKPVQEVSGTDPQMTDPFTVADAWVVRWVAPRQMNISVLAADGSLVSGAAGSRGALYVTKGGTYRLQIDNATPPASSSAPGSAPGQQPRPMMSSRPYEIQVVQLSSAMVTPSRTMWAMPNYNLPGKGVANLSGLNGPLIPGTPIYFPRPVQPSSPSPAPMNGNSAPAGPDSSTPPPDAGG